VTVPANTTATVILAGAKSEQLTVNAKSSEAKMKETLKQSDKGISLNIGSGHYVFRYPVK